MLRTTDADDCCRLVVIIFFFFAMAGITKKINEGMLVAVQPQCEIFVMTGRDGLALWHNQSEEEEKI